MSNQFHILDGSSSTHNREPSNCDENRVSTSTLEKRVLDRNKSPEESNTLSSTSGGNASDDNASNTYITGTSEYFPEVSGNGSEGNTLFDTRSLSASGNRENGNGKANTPVSFQNIFPSLGATNNMFEQPAQKQCEYLQEIKDTLSEDRGYIKSKWCHKHEKSSKLKNKTSQLKSESAATKGLVTTCKHSEQPSQCSGVSESLNSSPSPSKSPELSFKPEKQMQKFKSKESTKRRGMSDKKASAQRKRKLKTDISGKVRKVNLERNKRESTANAEVSLVSQKACSKQTPALMDDVKQSIKELPIAIERQNDTKQSENVDKSVFSSNYSNTSSFTDSEHDNLYIDETTSKKIIGTDEMSTGQKYSSLGELKAKKKHAKQITEAENILTTTEREQLLMHLIQNLTCNLFYNTFCFSIPKPIETSRVYRYFVKEVADLVIDVSNNSDLNPSSDMPLEKSIEKADRVVEDMRERYAEQTCDMGPERLEMNPDQTTSAESNNKSESRSSGHSSCNIDKLEQEVDNDLPHNAVFLVSDLHFTVRSSYAGQIVVCINPVNNIMSLSFFTYVPSYSDESQRVISRRTINETTSQDIKRNMEMFEISRQLRMDIPLDTIQSVNLFSKAGTCSPGFILLKVTKKPRFLQRWIHTRTRARNNWQERENFLPFICTSGSSFFLFLGGTTDDISDIGAMLGRSDEHLITRPQLTNPPFSTILRNVLSPVDTFNEEDISRETSQTENRIQLTKQRQEMANRCSGFVDILTKHKLLNPVQANELKVSLIEFNISRDFDSSKLTVNTYDDGSLQACLRDYIFYRCSNAEELEQHLSAHLNDIKENKLTDVTETNLNFDTMTVVDFLKIEQYFYSFCLDKIVCSDDFQHCTCCHMCTMPISSHLFQNKSHRPFCSNCGMIDDDDFLLVPKSLTENRLLYEEDVVKECGIQYVRYDLVQFSDPCEDLNPEERPKTVLFLEDDICDPLGLSDPIAFLLGGEARGKFSHQGRCIQKYRKKEKPDGDALPCTLQ